MLGIYKILTCIYKHNFRYIYIYIYNLLWATGFDLSFRPPASPLSNLKFSQSVFVF